MLKEVTKVSPQVSKNITVPVTGSPKMSNIMQSIANSLPPHLSPVKITFTKPATQTTNATTQKVISEIHTFSASHLLPSWLNTWLIISNLIRWSSWRRPPAPTLCPTSCQSLTMPPYLSLAPPPSWPRPPRNKQWSSQPAPVPPSAPVLLQSPQWCRQLRQWSCQQSRHVCGQSIQRFSLSNYFTAFLKQSKRN